MKFTTKITLAILIGTGLLYTACKKDQSNSASNTNSTVQNGQIAVNLYKALTGQYGGANVGTGLTPPATLNANRGGKMLQTVNALCGSVLDTAYTNTRTGGDTTYSSAISFKFVYNCNGAGAVNGYTLTDSLNNTAVAPNFNGTAILGQDYSSTEVGGSTTKFFVKGEINSTISNIATGTTPSTESLTSQYVLTGLTIDNSTSPADITTGQAKFTMTSVNGKTTTNYTGTITFLGGHMAKLNIVGIGTFSVNLITGTSTKM
jgi:hypothetical protein